LTCIKAFSGQPVHARYTTTKERTMRTISELAATIAIWALLAIGIFFGLRAAWRKRRNRSR